MATWNDKQLQGHKRAQSHISAGTAALGTAALGAAGLKSKTARKGAVKLARATGGGKTGSKILRGTKKAGASSGGLTTASAGVGGVGGFNFAAIQSQEAKRQKQGMSKSLSPDVENSPFSEVAKLSDRAKDNLVGARAAKGRTWDAYKTNLAEQGKGAGAGLGAGAAAGALAAGGLMAATHGKMHAGAFRAAKTAAPKMLTTGKKGLGTKLKSAKPSARSTKYAARATKSSLTNPQTRKAAGLGAAIGGGGGYYGGAAIGADKGNQKNRAAGNYRPREKKAVGKSVGLSKALQPDLTDVTTVVLAKSAGLSKAFDPERRRTKRMDAYSAGAYAGAGAAGAAGAGKLRRQGTHLSTALKGGGIKTPQLKAIGRQGGKGAGLLAAGGLAAYGGKKISDASQRAKRRNGF